LRATVTIDGVAPGALRCADRIHRVFHIDLPRPRNEQTQLSHEFVRVVGEINRELYRVMS
jgi:hypothetical protein